MDYEYAKEKFAYLENNIKNLCIPELYIAYLLYQPNYVTSCFHELYEANSINEIKKLTQEINKIYGNNIRSLSLYRNMNSYLFAQYVIEQTEQNPFMKDLSPEQIIQTCEKRCEEFLKEHSYIKKGMDSYLHEKTKKSREDKVRLENQKYDLMIQKYMKEYDENPISYAAFARKHGLVESRFYARIKMQYPEFYKEHTHKRIRLSNETKEKEKDYLIFLELLKTMDPKKHIIDVIDYYEITNEEVSDKPRDLFRMKEVIDIESSKILQQFLNANRMDVELTEEEVLKEENKLGYMINGNAKYATKQDKLKVLEDLHKRNIPIYHRTVSAQLRRNWKLNSDWHYEKQRKEEKTNEKKRIK